MVDQRKSRKDGMASTISCAGQKQRGRHIIQYGIAPANGIMMVAQHSTINCECTSQIGGSPWLILPKVKDQRGKYTNRNEPE